MKKLIETMAVMVGLFGPAQQALCDNTAPSLQNKPPLVAVTFSKIAPKTAFTELEGNWGHGVCPQTQEPLTADLALTQMGGRFIWTQPDTIEGFFYNKAHTTFHPIKKGLPDTDFQILSQNISAICGKYTNNSPQVVPMKVDETTGKPVPDARMLAVYLQINMDRVNKAMKPMADRDVALSDSPEDAGKMTLKDIQNSVIDPELAKQIWQDMKAPSKNLEPDSNAVREIESMQAQAFADQERQNDLRKQGIDLSTIPVKETPEEAAAREAEQKEIQNLQRFVGMPASKVAKILNQEAAAAQAKTTPTQPAATGTTPGTTIGIPGATTPAAAPTP
ncbi:MAG: hypothetical protein PHW63_07335 [Alphaproteobacteria bacterium]|nr:hypothetical protein [Alphaproteobacteria bacterium]